MQFADIEMLDIPDDLSVTLTSQTESMSDSPRERAGSTKEYPTVQEWLHGGPDLKFQFDESEYKSSSRHKDDFSHAQTVYITQLYKIVEDLANKNITQVDLDETDEPVGVITLAKDIGANSDREYKVAKINLAFGQIVDAFNSFYDTVKEIVDDQDAEAYGDLLSLLDCIQANSFAITERQKPELIIRWLNRYDPKPDNDFIDAVMYDTPKPYLHPLFWTAYLGDLLTRGMFPQAVSSLQNSKYDELKDSSPELYAIITDLITVLDAYTSMALKGQFPEWKYTVCGYRDNFKKQKALISDVEHIAIASQIHDLLCVISGLPKTIASYVTTWYEMYGALSLYQVRDDESVFDDYFKLAIAEKGSNSASKLEQDFCDLLTEKYLRVILAIDSYHTPTAAYVSKLFELKGLLTSYYDEAATKTLEASGTLFRRLISDYLLTRHAFECFEVHLLVPVGVGLLLNPVITPSSDSLTRNRLVIGEFMPHYECFTNDDMEWAMTVCAKLNLTDTIKKLYLKQGEKSLKEGHIFEALNMLVNCYEDVPSSDGRHAAMTKVHYIVWELLFQDCLLNSTPVPDELILNVVTNNIDPEFEVHPVIRQCLAPYAVLAEYFGHVGEPNDFSKNISRLFHLLRFKYLPQKFVPLLLAQLLPFFAGDQFQLPELVVIIELIESAELETKGHADDFEDLYKYASENIPENTPQDWRNALRKQGREIPSTVTQLLKEIRQQIVVKIGQVYIK